MTDELQAQIDARASRKQQYGKKPTNKSWKKQDKLQETPIGYAADLQIPHKVFAQHGGQVLGPSRPLDIGPSSRGVVLVDQQDALPLRKMQTQGSQQGLALLVLAAKANAALHSVDPIRFPAICVATQERTIVSGYMYHLGAIPVHRPEPVEKIAVDQIETEAIRCLIFQGPSRATVKAIFGQEPLLQHSAEAKSPRGLKRPSKQMHYQPRSTCGPTMLYGYPT